MKILLTSISLALMLAPIAAFAQHVSPSSTERSEPRVVRVEGTVNGPVSEVWRVWTTSTGAEEFFAEKANIQLSIGGPYESQNGCLSRTATVLFTYVNFLFLKCALFATAIKGTAPVRH